MAKLFIIMAIVLPLGLWVAKKVYDLWQEEEKEAEEQHVKDVLEKSKKLDKLAKTVRKADVEKMKKDQQEINTTKDL